MDASSQYFEGILQLRNPTESIINAALDILEGKEKVQIAKIKEVKNGIDIYVSSQKFLRSLGNNLQKKFGGQLEVSRKLHTQNRLTSRRVYRVNVLLKLPRFKKGDVVEYKGDRIKIMGMSKKVLAKNLETGKKLSLNYKDLP